MTFLGYRESLREWFIPTVLLTLTLSRTYPRNDKVATFSMLHDSWKSNVYKKTKNRNKTIKVICRIDKLWWRNATRRISITVVFFVLLRIATYRMKKKAAGFPTKYTWLARSVRKRENYKNKRNGFIEGAYDACQVPFGDRFATLAQKKRKAKRDILLHKSSFQSLNEMYLKTKSDY